MTRFRLYASFFLVVSLGFQAGLEAKSAATDDAVVFAESDGTTYYRAVFAHYLAVIPNKVEAYNVDCGISISNVCAVPEALSPLMGGGSKPTTGKLAIYLYNNDGNLTIFTPQSDAVGLGLNANGSLSPGATWTVRLAQILAVAWGVEESEVEFNGYGWVLSEFDCLAGTYNNTIFGLGFTQAFEFHPGMGQGGFFGGVMVPLP
jgi:hypothetical protein